MNDHELAGRVALVTGGSRGIGRACCTTLAAAGAAVAVNYRSNDQAAAETVELVEQSSGRAMAVAADVSDDDDVNRMVGEVEEVLGPIDILVNNAGIFDFGSHETTTAEQWRRTLDVNLTGAFLVSWAIKDGMIERGFGRIVNVSSIAGLRARPNSIAYAASKSGMIGLTKSFAEAVAGYGLTVNAIAPGLIATEILDGVEQEVLDQLVEATPMGRIGAPEDIARVVLFLVSELSGFMTGQTLVASGGRVMLP